MRFLTSLSVALWLVSIPTVAYLQETEQTGTGTTTVTEEEETGLTPAEREARRTGFKQAILQTRKSFAENMTKQAEIRKQRSAHGRTCREAIRSANRDTKLETMLDCVKEDLTFEMQLIDLQKQFISVLPGIQKDARDRALARLENLLDSIKAIMEGIERNLYGNEEELREAKRNLTSKYRVPQWTGITHARSDALLSWIAHILNRIETVREAEPQSEEIEALVTEAVTCLEDAEKMLMGVFLVDDYQESKSMFSQGQFKLKNCTDLILEADKKRSPRN